MAADRIFSATLIERIKRTPSIESFRFKPDQKIDFLPGQFLQVIFDKNNKNNKILNKYLSFSASSTNEYIEVTKRLSDSDFSAKLKNLKINDRVSIKAPMGNCIYKNEYKKIAFLIGGIGITPVVSIIEYINDKRLDTNIILFYSNRTEEEIAFKSELDKWQVQNRNTRVFYTIIECQPKDPNCIFGYINKELVSANTPDLKERVIFIFGPPKMVETMKTLCLELGCSPDKIKTESFIGY